MKLLSSFFFSPMAIIINVLVRRPSMLRDARLRVRGDQCEYALREAHCKFLPDQAAQRVADILSYINLVVPPSAVRPSSLPLRRQQERL
jgi:hypothetical protein